MPPYFGSVWAVASCLGMLETHGTGSLGSLDIYPKCEFDASSASPVIARTDLGRPAPLLIGWNRKLRPIDIELKDSEDKNDRVSGVVSHVVNLDRTCTSLTTLCHISEPITTFTCSKQVIEAVRDAIKGMLLNDGQSSRWLISRPINIGHKVLVECGLLHQDISASNVSLAKSGQFKGFLHNLDYSIYARERGQDENCRLGTLSYGIPRMGTFEFMARDILGGDPHPPKDDLESFFWLLAWTIFRRMNYARALKSLKKVFNNPWDARSARAAKTTWLADVALDEKIVTERNVRTESFIPQLARLLLEPDVDHNRMLLVFEDVLNRLAQLEGEARRAGDE
ncbi:hypothetical protein F5887DRAFT_92617 [Amanita rubescens]|nr:hypothetical protein F5887DRAFT_92617 [Amanita rubescens]